eukprot:SAG22_NODE_1831_length_3478_cov_1.539805_3_plen_192_part_00
MEYLDNKEWGKVAAMMLDYYDKGYKVWEENSGSLEIRKISCPTADAAANAEATIAMLPDVVGSAAAAAAAAAAAPAPEPEPTATAPESAPGVARYQGSCHCGEVTVVAIGTPRAVSYCHCSVCRRLSGAPFSAQALFGAPQVQSRTRARARDVHSGPVRSLSRCPSRLCERYLGPPPPRRSRSSWRPARSC